MISVKLIGYRVDEIEFLSKLENHTKIELGHSYQYNVQYNKEKNLCQGSFNVLVNDKNNPDKFKVQANIIGLFQFDPDERRETVHAESYKALFPYVKSLVTTITANCGIQPIIIPEIDIDSQEIYRYDGNSN